MNADEEFENPPYIPTEEDIAGMNAFIALADAHPTCVLLLKAVERHARLHRLLEMNAPECIVEECTKMRDAVLNELCEALPFYTDTNTYSLAGIVAHLQEELDGSNPGKRAD